MNDITNILKNKIMVFDGAMGTMLQSYNLTEKDFRGERFKDHTTDLKGNNDFLCIVRPDIVAKIHKAYFDSGADIIETNTFNANAISQKDYQTEKFSYEINFEAAKIAKSVAKTYKDKPRFVAGAIGPTNRTASLSPDVNNPDFRNITFDELKDAYYEQAKGLLDGGVDLFLIETVFDTLNCKAAIFAVRELLDEKNKDLPLFVSGTITDASGRTLSGQTVEAFWNSIRHADITAVGLNCALGAKEIRPWLNDLSKIADTFVFVYPNAGLPNEFGEYDETPQEMSEFIEEFAWNWKSRFGLDINGFAVHGNGLSLNRLLHNGVLMNQLFMADKFPRYFEVHSSKVRRFLSLYSDCTLPYWMWDKPSFKQDNLQLLVHPAQWNDDKIQKCKAASTQLQISKRHLNYPYAAPLDTIINPIHFINSKLGRYEYGEKIKSCYYE